MNRNEFKFLTPNERQFIEKNEDLLKKYKNPEAMARQYNNRIKYRTINAIFDLSFVVKKLPEEQLQKIFSNELFKELFTITEKAVSIAFDRKPVKKQLITENSELIDSWVTDTPQHLLIPHMKQLMEFRMDEHDLQAHQSLKEKYHMSPTIAYQKMIENEVRFFSNDSEIRHLKDYLKRHELLDDYEEERENALEKTLRENFKNSKSWGDEQINNFLVNRRKNL